MRALLIVNPHATSTTQLHRDVIASALASAVELEVVQTRYRGHAAGLAATAAAGGCDLIITLGGDGTVNEAVNGIMRAAGPDGTPGPAAARPALAALPGGNANVFTRSLGLPASPVDAAGRVLHALAAGQQRTIGLGVADGRYFAFNAGLGLDAEVVRAVEGRRAHGVPLTPAMYARTALRQYFRLTDRRRPALSLEIGGTVVAERLYIGIVANTAPWTFLGRRPVQASPAADFEAGLDLLALRSLRAPATARVLAQMLARGGAGPSGGSVLALHDQPAFTLAAGRPVAMQVDGEYVGERERVGFCAAPRALRVVA